jgi:hypothetical protein
VEEMAFGHQWFFDLGLGFFELNTIIYLDFYSAKRKLFILMDDLPEIKLVDFIFFLKVQYKSFSNPKFQNFRVTW